MSRLREEQTAAMSRLREEQTAAMSRLREEQTAAMSRLREEQTAAMSRLREEQTAAMSRLREEPTVWSPWNRPANARSGRSALVTMPGAASTTARMAFSAGIPVTVIAIAPNAAADEKSVPGFGKIRCLL